MVPVVASTALSTKTSFPTSGGPEPLGYSRLDTQRRRGHIFLNVKQVLSWHAKCDFVRSRINRKQQLALLNEVGLFEMNFEKFAGHLGFHGDGIGFDVANGSQLHRLGRLRSLDTMTGITVGRGAGVACSFEQPEAASRPGFDAVGLDCFL